MCTYHNLYQVNYIFSQYHITLDLVFLHNRSVACTAANDPLISGDLYHPLLSITTDLTSSVDGSVPVAD